MIRKAKTADAPGLTRIAFDAKGVWGYPARYFDLWSEELTIHPSYIEKNQVFVFERQGRIQAFYSLVDLKADLVLSFVRIFKGLWLDHMFVSPPFMGKGIGTTLFSHMRKTGRTAGRSTVHILADPHARGFYERLGCRYIEEYPSSIRGRTTPLLVADLS